MKKQLTQIGLDKEKSQVLADKLNHLLANYQMFYMNTRGFHWNIKGDKFFELHGKFEELYDDSFHKIDEIAERILTLGHTPIHAYSDYSNTAEIEEARNISVGTEAIKEVINGYKTLLPLERELLKIAEEANDEGTNALMSDYVQEQEKLLWMYSAYLNEN